MNTDVLEMMNQNKDLTQTIKSYINGCDMSNFDYFKQYQSEQARIRQKIQDEENPIHRGHLVMIEQMIDDKIRSEVPMLMQQYNESQKVNVEAYFNGKPATDANIVKGVRDMVVKALKRFGKRG